VTLTKLFDERRQIISIETSEILWIIDVIQ
jgi:hypothetical protein